jgi:hypothetical protein
MIFRMKKSRIIAAFLIYAVAGLLFGAAFEGACTDFAERGARRNHIAGDRRLSQRILDKTVVAAKEIRFWILPALIAVGLGTFMAHTEHRDGTAFHFDNEPDSLGDSYDVD